MLHEKFCLIDLEKPIKPAHYDRLTL